MKSVLRSLDVLQLVSEHQPVTVGELTKLLDMPKTTVQRTLVTLHEAGWLRQTDDSVTSWEISSRILQIRPPALRDGYLLSAARAPMTELRDATQETIHIVIPDGVDGVVLVDRVDCDQPVRAYSPLGYRSPYVTTATGKAILANVSKRQADAILAGAEPTAEMTADLRRIRSLGYSLNQREHRPGVCAIGAAVFDSRHVPVAAICISMPESRFDESRVTEWASSTIRAAERISAAIR